jgi:Tfp pilus assembly protein PilV
MLTDGNSRRRSDAGITIIETAMAAFVLAIGSSAMIGLIVCSIATNNRNKLDSTQTMLATSIIEQVKSTIIGTGQSSLTDCAGATHTIDTAPGGANLSGVNIDFTENVAADVTKNNYHMDYLLRTPCTTSGKLQGTYDVRWHVQILGAGITQTRTYVLTVGARLKGHGEGNLFFSLPVNVRVMAGN